MNIIKYRFNSIHNAGISKVVCSGYIQLKNSLQALEAMHPSHLGSNYKVV